MTNPFSNEALVPAWTAATEILKGDAPGHAFRGNQYSQGRGGFANADSRSVGASSEALSPYHHGYYTGQAMALVRSARGLTTHVGSVISPEQADRDAATHELIAEKHRQIADALKKGDTAQQRQAEVHGLAADAHEQAAYLLNRLSSGPTFSANVAEYKSVNDNAAMFSRVAGKLMFDVNGGNVEGQLEELHLAEGADSEDLQTAHELIAEQHGNQAEMLREMAREERAAGRPNGDLLERIAAHNEASRRHDDVAMRIAAIDADDNPHPVSQKQALASSLEAGRGSDDASKTAR